MNNRIKEIIELRTKLKAVQGLLTEEKRILNELEKNRG